MDSITSVVPVIAYLDVDAFECQLHQRMEPRTWGIPCVVANQSGRILSVTHEAKLLGVSRKGTPTLDMALQVYPDLWVFRKPNRWGKQDNKLCRLGTYEMTSCLQGYLLDNYPDVTMEVVSSDEAYFDLSPVVYQRLKKLELASKDGKGTYVPVPHKIVWERENSKVYGGSGCHYRVHRKHEAERCTRGASKEVYGTKNEERLIVGAIILEELISHLHKTTQLHSSGGISTNKIMAKIAGAINKPNSVTVVTEEALRRRLSRKVPLDSVPGLGGELGTVLMEIFGVQSMAQLRRVSWSQLQQQLGTGKAQEVHSKAIGQDMTPVVQKLFRDKITCNKPRADITTVQRLYDTCYNLLAECQTVIQEEESRWGRTCNLVSASWKTDKCKAASNCIFDIQMPPAALVNTIHDNIKMTEGFNSTKFTMVEFSFSLKDWTRMSGSPTHIPASLVPNKLRIQSGLPEVIPQFKHNLLDCIRINKHLRGVRGDVRRIPHLLPMKELQQELTGYRLLRSFHPKLSMKEMIMDYTGYDVVKHKCFAKWIKDNHDAACLSGIRFVCFVGRLLRGLKTLINTTQGDWCIYATNVDGVIHLWDEKTSRSPMSIGKEHNLYVGFLFEKLVCGYGGRGPIINAVARTFPIQKVTFGKHNILMLGHFDATDENNEFLQVTAELDEHLFNPPNPCFVSERRLKLWAQAVASGSTNVIIGTKDNDNAITRVTKISVDELSQDFEEEQRKLCFVFLDRLLDWIQLHLTESNPTLVKKFSWAPGKNVVFCSTVHSSEIEDLIVPKIYLQD